MVRLLQKFIQLESLGSILLICATLLAIISSNSNWHSAYTDLLNYSFQFELLTLPASFSLTLFINDGLMAIFFLVIGLEIKREILEGNLSRLDQIVLPMIAALGGIIAPALIYIAFNFHHKIAMTGWAIPTATDIAFTLGVLATLGKRVPIGLKLFIMAVAIYDDVVAILIIGVFYTQTLSFWPLLFAAVCLFLLYVCNRKNVSHLSVYFLLGAALWLCVLKSGIHATLAGVILAFTIPCSLPNSHYSPLKTLEKQLHPWVVYLILPVFAYANAGIYLKDVSLQDFLSPITLGIAMGLFLGKQSGIFLATYFTVRFRLASLPHGCRWSHIYGGALLCGIGFTMSLFIGSLAFQHHLHLITNSRLGIFLGTLASAALGFSVLRSLKHTRHEHMQQ